MLRLAVCASLAVLGFVSVSYAQSSRSYDALIATHAAANRVPESLVRRVILRESRYNADLVGHGGTIGLMQIKLATARGLGYTGDAAGLRDPDTNLTYGVKYLAGAWRAANSDHARAMHYYAGGYYYVAKRQRAERSKLPIPLLASAPPKEVEPAKVAPAEAAAEPKQALKPVEAVEKPKEATISVPTPRKRPKKLAEAKAQVPRPPAALSGANAAKPR